nr:heme-binding beta-barrel domain-containing protein [Sphingomonas sp. Ant H11]
MNPFPRDIFTEPSDVDPDTLANLGPLRPLAGTWRATKGSDTAPKPAGPEQRTFIEHIVFEPIDPQANGPQLFYGLRYHIHITTVEEDITFHDQVGYWLWEPATGLILQTLAIPRGQTALASGHGKPGDKTITLTATRGPTNYGICSTDFLEDAFRTDAYRIDITFNPDDSWSYDIQTTLAVRGQDQPFLHHDRNTLHRIGAAKPNPWSQILAKKNRSGAILISAPAGGVQACRTPHIVQARLQPVEKRTDSLQQRFGRPGTAGLDQHGHEPRNTPHINRIELRLLGVRVAERVRDNRRLELLAHLHEIPARNCLGQLGLGRRSRSIRYRNR